MDRFNHVQSILRTVSQLELAGIDIAYLDLDKKHRTSFTLFIAELANALHRQGKQLTLTLPMPVVVNEEPLQIDEGAYDWKQLGEYADILKIWPLRDQSLYPKSSTYGKSGNKSISDTNFLKNYAKKKKPNMGQIVETTKKKKEIKYLNDNPHMDPRIPEGPEPDDIDMFDDLGNYIGD